MSFFFLWIGTFIFFENTKSIKVLVFHILFLVLLCFSRDNMPYFILLFYFGFVLLKLIQKEKINFLIGFLFISVILFFISDYSIEVGKRYRLPIINNIVVRILPDKSYVDWFEAEGMPMRDSLEKNFKNINPTTDSKLKVYTLYNDSSYKQLFKWVNAKGKKTYLKFMLTHPSFFFS